MAKKVLYTDFVDTNTVIENYLNSPEMKRALRRKALFDMWDKSVGLKFAEKSKPYSIKGKIFIVACQNSAVAQELLLNKAQIMTKIEPYLKSLNITVSDIKFDTKRWVEED